MGKDPTALCKTIDAYLKDQKDVKNRQVFEKRKRNMSLNKKQKATLKKMKHIPFWKELKECDKSECPLVIGEYLYRIDSILNVKNMSAATFDKKDKNKAIKKV